MVTLRLFHSANPFQAIESRVLGEGEIAVGRDPAADWHIEDAACELSRRHCAIHVSDDGVRVRDMSANGVFVGVARQRIAKDFYTQVAFEEPIHLGQYMIVAGEGVPAAANENNASIDAPFHSPILQEPEISASAFAVRSVWNDAQPASAPAADRPRIPDAALLEAFCDGAGIDPSAFAAEVPADVMRRAGEAYRQAVIGLCDLMGERTSVKSAYRMDRTTVSATGNNPFKWADAHRVGVDLLRAGNGSFLAGSVAIKESFEDLKKHLICLMAGSRAAVAATLEEVGPARIEESVKGQSMLFQTKVDASWREFLKRHTQISSDARENADSAINRAFRAAYERQLHKLDELGTQA
ncbi:MAG TPA: type VI secretion system-associated FHA domain protein TagH [Candidatus Binatia bacterium]|nr:type VI secretion system-associated FHA domain protein TagH [Candidatus Binatia bacterium]